MSHPAHELWPPLSLIRSTFVPDEGMAVAAHSDTSVMTVPGARNAAPPAERADAQHLLLPLTELAQRREAVAQRAFPARWAPGRLVSVLHEGRLLGVLLDKCVQGDLWQGWLAASEADWAGAFDVLLEPEDEPFEPMFGLVQTWNALTLRQTPQLCARVLGEVSATRLAAIRAVHDEWAARLPLAIDPEPGRIALRTAGGVFSVLSGTPLGQDDPRAAYQALYSEVARPLAAASTAAGPLLPPPATESVSESVGGGLLERLRGWFAADRFVRPAFAVLALVVVVQNVGIFGARPDDEEVRFRSTPPLPASASTPELLVRWKPGVRVDETGPLLQSIPAEVVGGPDAEGRWRVRLTDPVGGLALLSASPLVESVAPPSGNVP
ncbi:MAG: hypothetical protein EOO26_05955 [Comamonadaceae bacterium]|nr:MAG: hypothetical protein EOO26_05955 [Comamonadaceae bacterium]